MRKCSKCDKILPETKEYFSKNQSTNTGGDKYFRPECKRCTSKEGKGKRMAQKMAGNPTVPPMGTPCHNCGRTEYKKPLVFDHCHKTLRHRGWLCDNCNRAMGMLGDTPEALRRAARYMEEGNQHPVKS
jgi:hypothetical protein